MRNASAQHAEADEAVLFLQFLQSISEVVFLSPQLRHTRIPRTHDLPDLVVK